MSSRNRVIWSEGLFIKPQHFQQQGRALEGLLNERLAGVSRYLYGFNALELNTEYLSFGRIALVHADGVLPDGTAFNLPHDDVSPEPLEINDGSVANQIIYLALPMGSDSIGEVQWPESSLPTRYSRASRPVRDLHSENGDYVDLDVAQVTPRLMLEREDRSAYSTLAVGRILEKRADGSLVMDPQFIPTLLNVTAASVLHRFVGEMAGLMRERARNIANRISAPSQGSVADVSDFMLLQLLNRMHPQFQHLSRLSHLHPERLFEALVCACGELMTFTDESRLPQEYPPYDHNYPAETFAPLMLTMRQALSTVLEPRAVAIQLQKRRYGLMVAPLSDSTLLDSAEFILAVRAEMPLERLRKLFTQQTKIASVERIRDLISLQLPGVPLTPLPVAPRQLPYHAGYTYFQLDRQSQAWEMLRSASGFAFHVAGEFPGLELQFWAIRS